MGGHYLLWRAQGEGRFFALVRGRSIEACRERLLTNIEKFAGSYGVPLDRERWARGVEVLRGDITRPLLGQGEELEPLREAGIDTVWHFAANVRFTNSHREEVFRSNVQGTKNALELAHRLGVRRFIYVSTAYVSGVTAGRIPEALHPLDIEYVNVYEESKNQAEHEVDAFCRSHGIDHRILRPSVVVGPTLTHRSGGTGTGLYGFLTAMYRLRKSASKASDTTFLGDPELPYNLVPIDQAVRDMLHLERSGFAGGPIYHLTAGDEVSQRDVRDIVCENLGLPPPAFVRERPRAPTPVEEIFDEYYGFYGLNRFTPKRFERSLPHRTGINRDDLDAYVRFFYQELKREDGHSLFRRSALQTGDGVTLACYAAGDPGHPPAVLINAYGMPVDFWTPMAAQLSRSRRLMTWESRYVPTLTDGSDHERCDLEVQVRDLLAVLDHFGVARADLVGWCSGAQVALEFSARHPERVGRMVLLNGTYCGGADIPRTAFQRNFISLVNHVSSDRRKARIYYEMIYGRGEKFAASGQRERLQSLFAGIDPYLLHMTSAPFRNPEALFRYSNLFQRFFRHEAFSTERDAGKRTLVATTPTDVISHPDASVLISSRLKNAELLRLPEGDHYSLFHDVNLPGMVTDFLGEGRA
jgi:nucleoside-diphosphate-sugar epimerase/pimeloyl-ACP methyl ester carboxylesterase